MGIAYVGHAIPSKKLKNPPCKAKKMLWHGSMTLNQYLDVQIKFF
jgi:hypothetical protein